MSDKKKSRYLLDSVNNALKVLDILSVRDNIGVSEISRISNIDKSSVFKILYTLEHRDYVYKTADAKYRISPKLANFGDEASDRKNVVDVATPYLRQLRDVSHETVYLGVLNTSGRVIMVHKEDGDSPDHITTRIGYELDAYSNSMGLLLLAYLGPAMRDSIVNAIRFRPHTPKTISSKEALLQRLDELKGKSWAVDYDENYSGHSTMAAPIFDSSGNCIASVSIVCPTSTLLAHIEEFRPHLLNAANRISHKMGFTGQSGDSL